MEGLQVDGDRPRSALLCLFLRVGHVMCKPVEADITLEPSGFCIRMPSSRRCGDSHLATCRTSLWGAMEHLACVQEENTPSKAEGNESATAAVRRAEGLTRGASKGDDASSRRASGRRSVLDVSL